MTNFNFHYTVKLHFVTIKLHRNIDTEDSMAFFSKDKESKATVKNIQPKQEKKSAPAPAGGTTISKNIIIEGNISGTDSITIEGTLKGDITVNNVVIGQHGSVTGAITAQKVKVSGNVNGSITCNDLDIMHHGYVTNTIHANKVTLSGEILGDVLAENTINITPTGKIQTKSLRSKHITVNGTVEGKISASELLSVGSNGFVNGEISVKNIKTEEGGRVIGSMAMYEEPKPSTKTPKAIDTIIES